MVNFYKYNTKSNLQEELERLENELQLLNFEETQLKWHLEDIDKEMKEIDDAEERLYREWKNNRR